MSYFLVAKIARFSLVVYAVLLTGAVTLAVTAGPFQEAFRLWAKAGVTETKFKESERDRKKLEAERDRLLKTIKNLQADWAGAQETIRALRELTQNPDDEQRLVELNRLVERLSQERTVLILKLNELRQAIQTSAGKEPEPQ
jgi:predicted transcriptional regulator